VKKKEKQLGPAIVQSGDAVLRLTAAPVLKKDFGSKELLATIDLMNASLEGEFDGVAIAAPQIGISQRIFIISRKAFAVEEEKNTKKGSAPKKPVHIPEKNIVCINPEIIKTSRKKVKVPEGCLSVRWFYGNTMRHEKATIRAYDEFGKSFTLGGTKLIAQIFQHETDHLNGTLFIDHATEIMELSKEEIAEIESKGAGK